MSITPSESPGELAEILETMLSPARFEALIRPLLDAELRADARLGKLASASYHHPNGFDKLVLDVLDGGQKVVLHAWRPDREEVLEDSNFHDHRWHFATAVLAGAYRFVEYEEEPVDHPGGLLVHKHEYRSSGAGQGYELHAAGQCRLRPRRSERLAAGSVYLLECDTIHHITVDKATPTITLFVQGAPVRTCTRVFSKEPKGYARELDVHRFSTETYSARLRSVLDLLSPNDAAGGELQP
jgi:hypothetical protein